MGFGDGVWHDGIQIECGSRMSLAAIASASPAAEKAEEWIYSGDMAVWW
jgi:hypothetical protein